MKKFKVILPMLAFVLAIGISFAFVNTSAEKDYYATGYIQVPGGWATITVDCPDGSDDCLVKFQNDPTIYQVYTAKSTSSPALGDGSVEERDEPTPPAD